MRIIAGEKRGARLVAPAGRETRPTGDRAREALFAMLGDIAGLRVLDAFAGSGALGLEALSRGAAHATFWETSAGAAAHRSGRTPPRWTTPTGPPSAGPMPCAGWPPRRRTGRPTI